MPPFPSPTKIWRTEPYPTISPARPELSAKGKVVLITGGGTGIGASTARAFAQASATRIALLGRREKPLQESKASIQKEFPDVEVFVAPTDVTKKSDVDAAFAKFAGDGTIDVVVSNAGFIGPQEPVAEVTDTDGFLNAIHINVAGALYVAQAFSRHASKDGVAIEVNSSAAHVNFAPGFTAYSTAKLAVFKLWDSFAFGHPNLRVYHVQPGTINTDMNKEAGGVAALGFEDSVDLPGQFHLWLASQEAAFLNGRYLWVNWDVDELKTRAQAIEAGPEFTIAMVGWPFGDASWTSGWDSEKQKAATKGA